MTEFNPPISDHLTEELIEIAHSSKNNWTREAIDQAKLELEKRNITIEEQNQCIENWESEVEQLIKKEDEKEKELLKSNKTQGYNIWEMMYLFLLGPLIFVKSGLFNFRTLFELYSENFILKFKERLVILFLSFLCWFFLISYSMQKQEQKRLNEIENADISDWGQEFENNR